MLESERTEWLEQLKELLEFSTFTLETLRLFEVGQYANAALNVTVSTLVGLAGAGVGLAIGLAF